MDLDQLLQEKLGGISRYQWLIIFALSLQPLGSSFMGQTNVFFSAVPDYRCSVPPLDDPNIYPELTEENITTLMIPPGESCYRYDYNLSKCNGNGDLSCLSNSDPGTMECDAGYIYDDTYFEETTVSEWDLICGRTTLDSLANSMYFVGVFIGSFIVGPMMDWFGRKMSILILSVYSTIIGIILAFVPSYEVYIGLRTLLAIGSTSCYLAYYTYVCEIVDNSWRTVVSTLALLVSAIGHTLLPGVAYFLRDWRELCLCCALCCIPYFFVHFFIPRCPRWLLSKGLEDEAKKTIEKIAKSNKVELLDNDWNLVVKTEREYIEAISKQKKYVIPDLYRPPMMRIVSCNIIYLWFVVSLVFYGLTLNVGTLAGDPYVNATLNAFVEIIGYLLFIVCAKPAGMRITSSISYFLGGICCLTTMFLAQFADGNEAMIEASRWIAILGKLFASMSFTVVYQYTVELYPTVARGTAMSMGSMSARIGPIIMPFTLQLQQAIPWLTQTIFGTLGLIAGATTLMLPETSKEDLMTSIDQAENFYRRNMRIIAKLFRKTEVYQSESNDDKKPSTSGELKEGYVFKCDDEDMYLYTSKL
ncbi:organic cation transporter protein-like [Styela clava]